MSDTYQAVYDAARSKIQGGSVSDALESACRDAFGDVRHIFQAAIWESANEATASFRAAGRPSVLYRPNVGKDGNKWCALYGPNLMEGVCGFGDSPAEAMDDFDAEWAKKIVTGA
jgi:hypothetical protein